MSNNWTTDKILEFINEIHLHPVLWDVKSPSYRNRILKKDSWTSVGNKFGLTCEEAYKKFRSLRTYANRQKNGISGGKWFAFDAISFILDQDTTASGLYRENTSQMEGTLMEGSSLEDDQETFHENESKLICGTTQDKCLKRKSISFPSEMNKRKYHPGQASDALLSHTSKRQSQTSQDIPALYGHLLAAKLRRLSRRTQITLQNKIDNLVFEAELSELESSSFNLLSHSPNNVSTPILVYSNSPATDNMCSTSPENTKNFLGNS